MCLLTLAIEILLLSCGVVLYCFDVRSTQRPNSCSSTSQIWNFMIFFAVRRGSRGKNINDLWRDDSVFGHGFSICTVNYHDYCIRFCQNNCCPKVSTVPAQKNCLTCMNHILTSPLRGKTKHDEMLLVLAAVVERVWTKWCNDFANFGFKNHYKHLIGHLSPNMTSEFCDRNQEL